MIKLFRFSKRSLLAAILSLQLILLSTPTVFAAESNPASTSVNGTIKENLSGVADSEILSSLTMMAVGFVAARLKNYKMTTDIMIAAVGGAAFIIGETSSQEAFKKISGERTIEVNKSVGDSVSDSQINSLKELKKSYEEAKSNTEDKMKMQKAAAAAFAGAGIAALTLRSSERSAIGACLRASTQAEAQISAAIASSCPTTNPVSCQACTIASISNNKITDAVVNMDILRDKPAPTKSQISWSQSYQRELALLSKETAACPAGAGVQVCNAIPALFETTETFQMTTSFVINDFIQEHPRINKSFFEKLIDTVFVSKADASTMSLIAGVGGAGAALFALSNSLAITVDTFLLSPSKRALIWGVLGGLSLGAANSSKGTIDKLDTNIQKIDSILNGIKTTSNSFDLHFSTKISRSQNFFLEFLFSTANAASSENVGRTSKQKFDCLLNHGETNCKSMVKTMQALPDYRKLSPGVQAIALKAALLGDTISGTEGLTPLAIKNANEFAEKLPVLSNNLQLRKNHINEELKKSKLRPVDFKREEDNLLTKLNNATEKILKEKGTTPKVLLASINMTPIMNGADHGSNSEQTIMKDSVKVDLKQPLKRGAFSDGSFQEVASRADQNGKDVNTNYKYNNFDVTTNASLNIFEIISNRYLRTGLSRVEYTPIPEKEN